jgi:hypothetical protein
VTPFIIRFRKLTSAVAQTDLKLPDKAYIILFINAFRSFYGMGAERWLKLARSCNSIVTLDVLHADITHLDKSSGL